MKPDKIMLDHGSGGKISHRLTTDILLPVFNNPILAQLNDGAIFELQGMRFAFSTDSYTVDPIFFPGGNIGDLAINGTVNDVAMCGGNPVYLSVGLIIEEGFSMTDFENIISEMGKAAEYAREASRLEGAMPFSFGPPGPAGPGTCKGPFCSCGATPTSRSAATAPSVVRSWRTWNWVTSFRGPASG